MFTRIKPMKRASFLITALMVCTMQAQLSGGGEANPNLQTNKKALEKFRENRFGMFIHWGPVTLRGREIGWSRTRSIPIGDYDNLYKEFNPVLFSAEAWVRAAKEAGMKYLVLTTRHHDGFSLWDSTYSDYDMANTPYGKGVVKSLSDECKKQGLDFGVYYSVLDWWHPDYPVNGPDDKAPEGQKMTNPETVEQMNRYVVYMKNQLKELIDLTDPSMIWFDGGWEWPWTHEMGMDLYAYLRGLKDDMLINNRVDKALEGVVTRKIDGRERFAGDYITPEQRIGTFNNVLPWETCMTIANQWAWKPNDKLKSQEECIQTLVRTVGGDGNLLFNVGPMPDGRIEQRQINRLKEMGDWLKINGDAVYGTRGGPYKPTDYMVSTRKGNNIYLHLLKNPETDLVLPFPKGIEINKSYFLDGKIPVTIDRYKKSIRIPIPKKMPDDIVSVIVLELSKSAQDIEVIKRTNY